MSKLFLPSASQLDTMNEHLKAIATALAMDLDVGMDISTWEGIQRAVRLGVAPYLIPVGTQLEVNHSVYGTHRYGVVAHNYFKSAHDKNAHTMTLMCHDIIARVQFDAPEAFYYADTTLPKGTYNFTLSSNYSSWEAGTYQFTLWEDVPAGGQLVISGQSNAPLTSMVVKSYGGKGWAEPIESSPIYKDANGTSLGTLGVELNHVQRVSYGSNNYKESAIRQFLNSSASPGRVWTPQTKFDRPPSWSTGETGIAGFMMGLDEDFLSVVGEVVVPCAANNTYESPDSTIIKGGKYTITDKFYLASQKEIFGNNSDSVADDSVLFPYYGSADATDRIKYREGTMGNWWTRTPYSWSGGGVLSVNSTGTLNSDFALYNSGCSPVCNIV